MNNNMNTAHAAALLYMMTQDTSSRPHSTPPNPRLGYETPQRSKNKSHVRIAPAPKKNKALQPRGKRDPVNPIPFRI